MKIACNVCESAEAVVLCCADEAALCWPCDQKVHAANKLASKHQRVALISNSNSNSHLPNCDICQEAAGYFFCLEDRALLCRKCDVSIHTINSLVSSHQRFLLTGVKVALDQAASNSSDKIAEPERSRTKMPPFTGGSYGDSVQQWQLDDFLALTDFNQEYNYLANGSSKGDSGKLAESPMVGAIDVVADCFGHVPEASWAVPEMCSPPTASGLCWSKTSPHHQCRLGCDTFVLDVCCLPTPKRRRDF